jgi:hypothetical protein
MLYKIIAAGLVGVIAIAMSVGIMPASASHVENSCVIQKSNSSIMKCRNEIVDGQVVQIIDRSSSSAGNCLYDTAENGPDWEFTKESQSIGNCADSLTWPKSNVQAR